MIQVPATCQNEKSLEMNPARLTTGKVYIDYDRIVERVEAWIDTRNPRIPDCDGNQVKARIAQRVVEVSNEEYTQQAAAHVDESGRPLPPTSPFVVAGGLKICSETGAVSVSPRQWLRHIALFEATWLHMLAFLFIAIFRRSPADSVPTTLLMEAGGGYEECDDRFIRYCKQGPIAPLSSARWIIVRAPRVPHKPTDPNFSYVTQPLIHFAATHLQRSHRVLLLAHHLLAPMAFLRALLMCPVSVLLARDIAYVPMVRWLDKKALIEAIVVTTSSFMSQPLWMKGLSDQRFKLHMVWYSQNFIPKVYVGEQECSSLPSARHMRVDVHWVWTEGFKSYLRSLGQRSQIHVVGPILWYLPETITDLGNAPIKVAVFDITPLPDGSQAFGSIKNYYSVSTIQQFITDIVEICKHIEKASGKEVLILLKHKRKPKVERHDSQYIEFIEQMEARNPNFKLIDHQTNLFGLLEKCDVSISVPYTSTAYVAAKLEKHAIYYDPFCELVPVYEKNKFVYFASGKAELKLLIERYMNIDLGIEHLNVQ
jgi:hypothetical protein